MPSTAAPDNERQIEPVFLGENRPEQSGHVAIKRASAPSLFFGRYRQTEPGLGMIEPSPHSDRFMVSVEFQARGETDMFEDGRHLRRPRIRPGALGLFDMRASWAADVHDPFDNLNIFMPRQAFEDTAEDRGTRFLGFRLKVGEDNNDDVMLHLARAFLPALERPHELNSLFLEHLLAAVAAHTSAAYGLFSRSPVGRTPGLNSRQKHLVLEYIEANLHSDITRADLARVCGMSGTSFGRAFRQTMGVPPHLWVIRRRVQRAKQMLHNSDERIADIALACGFVDQSHLARVFNNYVGMSPSRWRRSL